MGIEPRTSEFSHTLIGTCDSASDAFMEGLPVGAFDGRMEGFPIGAFMVSWKDH